MQRFAKLKKILRRGFRATLKFRKFKVALNHSNSISLDCRSYCVRSHRTQELPNCLFTYLLIYLFTHLLNYLFTHLLIYLFTYLVFYLFTYLRIYLFTYLLICLVTHLLMVWLDDYLNLFTNFSAVIDNELRFEYLTIIHRSGGK